MASSRLIDLDGFDRRRFPKALAAAYPFKLRGIVVSLTDADTVEVFLDQAFGDTTTISVRLANLSAAEKRSRNPIEKALGMAAWAEAQDILYPGRAVGLTSLKPLEAFKSSLGRTLGLIEVDEEGAVKDYAALMLERKRQLAEEGIELGVWPSEDWPYEGMPPRSQDARFGPLSHSKTHPGEVDHLKARVSYTDTHEPEEQRKRTIRVTTRETPEEASERLATAENHIQAKAGGRTTPVFREQEEDTTRESMRPNTIGDNSVGPSSYRPSSIGGGPLRDSEDRTSNIGAKDLPRNWQQQQAFSPEEEPVSLKTEPARIVNIAMVVVLLVVNGAGIILSDEETGLIRQGVELLVEIAAVTGLIQYLRTRVWSEATHKTEVREALYKEPPVR